VSVFDPTKPTADPARRWQGADGGELPQGRAAALVSTGGKACWSVGGKAVVMASPSNDKPDWVYPLPIDAGEVVGLTPLADGVLVTCSSGVVIELSTSGEVKADATLPPGGAPSQAAAVRVSEREVLLPLADGTTSRLPLQKR